MLALVAPGQGAQAPGFLAPWLENPGFSAHLEWLSAVADMDLVTHGTVSDAETIRDTAVAQPLLVASSLASARLLLCDERAPRNTVVAGHSVGELS